MFKFNVLNKYFFSEYSKNVLNVTLIFLALGIILNLFEEINFFKDHNVSMILPLSLSFLKVPSLVYKLFPFIFLISSIILFVKLIQSEEITAIRIAGISNFKIIIFPTFVSLVFGIIIVLGINSITSKLAHKYLDIKNQYTGKNDYLAALTENGIWIKDTVDGKTNIIRASGLSENTLKNISIYRFSENNKHESRIESREADISSSDWNLKNTTIFYNENNTSVQFKNYSFKSNVEIGNLKNLFSNLDSVSFWDLNKLKENYKYLGYSTKEVDSEMQRSLSYPFFLMSMTLLAGVIVMNVKFRGNYLIYIFISIVLSVIIFYLNDFSKALGETDQISLSMSVWTPVFLVFIASAIGMIYVNQK